MTAATLDDALTCLGLTDPYVHCAGRRNSPTRGDAVKTQRERKTLRLNDPDSQSGGYCFARRESVVAACVDRLASPRTRLRLRVSRQQHISSKLGDAQEWVNDRYVPAIGNTNLDHQPYRSTQRGAIRLMIEVRITNRGNVPIVNPFLRVAELTRNVLLTRDPQTKSGAGARQTIDAGSDNTLSPGETVTTRLGIGIVKPKSFSLSLSLYGVAAGGTITPSSAV